MNKHLQWRYATKKFDSTKKIPVQEMTDLLEALRFSPSSFGLQPWKFVIVRNSGLREQLKKHAWNQSQITDADTLIVFCVLKNMDEKYIKNFTSYVAQVRGVSKESLSSHEQMMLGFLKSKNAEAVLQWMKNQVYIALGVFLAECASRTIDSCPMEGFDAIKFDEILGLSQEGLESVVLCTVGYRAEDDQYAKLAKVRFEKSEVFIDRP